MTMYSLPNFCRVCLKYDKNLIDLAHIENEPSETLMSKLEQCVSEVDWSAYKPLLCHPCIKRLNVAFGFRKQCVQSASVLKSYLELVKETQKKTESQNTACVDTITSQPLMVLPNQKLVKIVVGPQKQKSFQNVFLNLIPTPASLNPPALAPVTVSAVNKDTKDSNQNVFLNLNNTMQKYIPIAPNNNAVTSTPNQLLLTDTKTEELSVEIDPNVFGLSDTESSVHEDDVNDWDEVISQNQIKSKEVKTKLNGDNKGKSLKKIVTSVGGAVTGGGASYVPILPKHAADFLNSGQHFLSSDVMFDMESELTGDGEFGCESCQRNFPNVKLLKHHIKMFHMGKYPFKCESCASEYVTRVDYEMCVKSHQSKQVKHMDDSLTLKDFVQLSLPSGLNLSASDGEAPMAGEESMISCELCKRQFNSSTGLLRHKVRKHHQKNKKKYFIKGMKNAKCDICNREFSTQSYMHLHRKLHMRDDVGYKYKVFGKSKYPKDDVGTSSSAKEEQTADSSTTNLDPEMDEDSEPDSAKSKIDDSSDNIEKSKEEVAAKKITKLEDKEEDSDDNRLHMDIDDNSLDREETAS